MARGSPGGVFRIMTGLALGLSMACAAGLVALNRDLQEIRDALAAHPSHSPAASGRNPASAPASSPAAALRKSPESRPGGPTPARGASASGAESKAAPTADGSASSPGASEVLSTDGPDHVTARLDRLEAAQRRLEQVAEIPYYDDIKISVASEIRSMKSRLRLSPEQVDKVRAFLTDFYVKTWGFADLVSEEDESSDAAQAEAKAIEEATENYEKNLLALFNETQIREYHVMKVEQEAKQKEARERAMQQEQWIRQQQQNQQK